MSLIVFGLGAVVAAVGTGVLTARSVRTPRLYLIAWALALFGLAIGMGAATLSIVAGSSGLLFRAMELGGQVLTPLSLCIALVEIAGKSVAARFAMRLAVSAITIIAVVIAGTDPLTPNAAFTKAWPDPAAFYQPVPLVLLGGMALFVAVTAIGAAATALVRSSHDPEAKDATQPLVAVSAAALLIVLPGLSWLAQKLAGIASPVPAKDAFALGGLLAAALTWFAATVAERRGVTGAFYETRSVRRGSSDWPGDATGSQRSYETGEFDRYGAGSRRRQRYEGQEERARSDYRDNPGYDSLGSDADYHYPALAALAAEADPPDAGRYGGRGPYDEDARYREAGHYDAPDRYRDPDRFAEADRYGDADLRAGPSRHGQDDRYGEADDYLAQDRYAADRYGEPGRGDYRQSRDDESAQLFGQIAIYTLIEDRVEEFDRLTERVVAQVRASEPDTLVYIVHAVPTAPMQRILYEVYRDRAAHEFHLSQPYVLRYEADRRPYVLATNVIELGLQQAKVTPLPSFSAISDMLSESGIDLTGVTRSSRQNGPPPGAAHSRPGQYGPAPQAPAGPDQAAGEFGDSRYGRPYQGGWADIRGDEPRYP